MWTAGVRLPVGCGSPRLKSNRESKSCCFYCSAKIWPSCLVAALPADPLVPDVKIVWRGRPRPGELISSQIEVKTVAGPLSLVPAEAKRWSQARLAP